MFHMPIRGSLALVIVVDVLGALAFAGIGLLVACRATTTETVSGLMNLVMLPMWLFSGVFFSSERFPGGRPAVHPGPAAHPAGRCAAARHPRGGRLARRRLRLAHPRRLGGRHLRPGPALLPLDLTSRSNRGCRRTRRSPTTSPRTGRDPRSGGTSTSSIRWPKKVALARISMSRNDDADWSGIAASFSSRWSRQGEWTSRNGTAKTSRRGSDASQRDPLLPAAGRPAADDVVAVVDGLQERFEVGLGPRLLGGRDQHERQAGPRPDRGSASGRGPILSTATIRVSTGRPIAAMMIDQRRDRPPRRGRPAGR